MAPSVSIREYYAGKSIFITGSTGFMGKVLVEKLLRCCPDIKKIYMLMRPKKGHSSKERLDDFIHFRLFERLHKENPKSFEKLQVIPGDILLEDLGISAEDRKLLQEQCQVVFHVAACVRFDMFLRDAVNMNTVGTKRVLDLGEGIKNLEAFVHVSTSYCRCEVKLLEEKLYPAKHRPEDIMHCTSWMDDQLLQHMQPELIEPQPNTYAYTKSLTEDLVSQYEGKFPIVIARPSIVTAAHREPLPGWVDNMNGPTGLLVGAGKGVVRTMHCNDEYLADVVPVDMAVNACIILAYTTGMDKPKEIRFCNITNSGMNPLSWGEALDIGRFHVQEFPFSVCLWYPGGSPKKSRIHHLIALFFTHLLPAYFVDLLLLITGNKTFMVKMQKRINYGLEVLQYYTTKEWHFKNDNFLALRKQISEEDDQIFYTDIGDRFSYSGRTHVFQANLDTRNYNEGQHSLIETIIPAAPVNFGGNEKVLNWSTYIRDYIKGAREFCCKEDPSTLPQARRLNKQLYYLERTLQTCAALLFGYLIFYYSKILFTIINL